MLARPGSPASSDDRVRILFLGAAPDATFVLARTRTGFFPDGSLRAAQRAAAAPAFDYKGSHLIR